MKKGFILTMDAMVALMVGAVLVTGILYFVTRPSHDTGEQMYAAAADFLAVGDKEGSIVDALNGRPGDVSELMYSMPHNLCLNLTVVNASGQVFYSNSSGCNESYSYVMAKRIIVNGTDYYTARARVWSR